MLPLAVTMRSELVVTVEGVRLKTGADGRPLTVNDVIAVWLNPLLSVTVASRTCVPIDKLVLLRLLNPLASEVELPRTPSKLLDMSISRFSRPSSVSDEKVCSKIVPWFSVPPPEGVIHCIMGG